MGFGLVQFAMVITKGAKRKKYSLPNLSLVI